jgi:hypothetical protein
VKGPSAPKRLAVEDRNGVSSMCQPSHLHKRGKRGKVSWRGQHPCGPRSTHNSATNPRARSAASWHLGKAARPAKVSALVGAGIGEGYLAGSQLK